MAAGDAAKIGRQMIPHVNNRTTEPRKVRMTE